MAAEKTVETLTTNLVTTTPRKQVPVAQKMLIKDVRIDNFHGRDKEDISHDEITPKYRKKNEEKKKEKTGFVALVEIRRYSYSELQRHTTGGEETEVTLSEQRNY